MRGGRQDGLCTLLLHGMVLSWVSSMQQSQPAPLTFPSLPPSLMSPPSFRSYIVDSVAYLKGLVSAGEVVPAAKQYRDRILARLVADALQVRGHQALGLGCSN